MPLEDMLRAAKDDAEAQETGAATHPVSSAPTLVLVSDTRMFIQENVYAILGHGNFQRRLLFTGMLSVVVLLLHAFANFLIGRDVDHWCRPPERSKPCVQRGLEERCHTNRSRRQLQPVHRLPPGPADGEDSHFTAGCPTDPLLDLD
ncbi:hypothetical protein MTO96_016387 [Rhipicephalus appendiculatus]